MGASQKRRPALKSGDVCRLSKKYRHIYPRYRNATFTVTRIRSQFLPESSEKGTDRLDRIVCVVVYSKHHAKTVHRCIIRRQYFSGTQAIILTTRNPHAQMYTDIRFVRTVRCDGNFHTPALHLIINSQIGNPNAALMFVIVIVNLLLLTAALVEANNAKTQSTCPVSFYARSYTHHLHLSAQV